MDLLKRDCFEVYAASVCSISVVRGWDWDLGHLTPTCTCCFMTLLQYEVLIRIDLVEQTLNKNFSTFLFEDTHPKTTTEKEKHLTISGEIMA